MGSMAMSTFMMFVPQHAVFLFLVICCVGFFGIYIPYQENKKRGKTWKPPQWLKGKTDGRKPVRQKRTTEFDHISAIGPDKRRRLDQLESLKTASLIDDREYREKRRKILEEP